jgi:hypothetical protein
VALPQYQTIYLYTAYKLWIAYGIAIMFSTTGVLIGLLAVFLNGVSYTNHFSTILQTARYARRDTDILPEDTDGKDPLPVYLAKAQAVF